MHRLLIPLALLGVTACGWNALPDQNERYIETLWDADGAVAAVDGLYVRLPHAGQLARVAPGGEAQSIDTGPGRVVRTSLAPDQSTVIAFVERYRCTEDDPREARDIAVPEDCPYDDLDVRTELLTIRDAEVDQTIEVDGHFNAVSYSSSGQFGIAYLDFSAGVDLEKVGPVDLTSVLVMDFETGASTPVKVGVAADRVLFTGDEQRAIVLSRSSVAVLDLTSSPPVRETKFPLTLDADQSLDPVDVAITPDGEFALITVSGRGDLYVLDLIDKAVNIVSLPGAPAAMEVLETMDETVLVYRSSPTVDRLEHRFFETSSLPLDEPMSEIIDLDTAALLWDPNNRKDVYRLDLLAGENIEYRLENPPISMSIAPDRDVAVALTRPEASTSSDPQSAVYDQNPLLEILDLTATRSTEPTAFLLDGTGVGLAWSKTDTALFALVLQEGQDYLFQLDLYTLEKSEIELSAPPVAIGSLPDGTFFITHEVSTGLVTFIDPVSGSLTETSGFASLGAGVPVDFETDEEQSP